MLEFKSASINDREWIDAYYRSKNIPSAKYSFASNFIWQGIYPAEYCEYKGSLFTKFGNGRRVSFLLPAGPDSKLEENIAALREYAAHYSLTCSVHGIYKRDCGLLSAILKPGETIDFLRDESDYIYNREDLAALAGRKYHSKRNHIARFKDAEWRYESMDEGNIRDAIAMHHEWAGENHVCPNGESPVWLDTCASLQAFKHFHSLRLTGGVLYREGRPVAYSIGEELTDDTFVVHFEKAFADIQGAYAAINQQFVINETEGYTYINREEDAGDPGLREAKLSYGPAFILEEYGFKL